MERCRLLSTKRGCRIYKALPGSAFQIFNSVANYNYFFPTPSLVYCSQILALFTIILGNVFASFLGWSLFLKCQVHSSHCLLLNTIVAFCIRAVYFLHLPFNLGMSIHFYSVILHSQLSQSVQKSRLEIFCASFKAQVFQGFLQFDDKYDSLTFFFSQSLYGIFFLFAQNSEISQ